MNEDTRNGGDPWARRVKLTLIGFGLIAGFFLIAEHEAHVVPYLPFLLLAACPLMHMFMHGGHGHRGFNGADDRGQGGEGRSAPPSGVSSRQQSADRQ